jgi:hypothetical protein
MAEQGIGELTHLPPPGGRGDACLAELLCALSFATGLALGDRMEHGIGAAYISLRLADELGLGPKEREAAYYGALLKDAGCTACAPVFDASFPRTSSLRWLTSWCPTSATSRTWWPG